MADGTQTQTSSPAPAAPPVSLSLDQGMERLLGALNGGADESEQQRQPVPGGQKPPLAEEEPEAQADGPESGDTDFLEWDDPQAAGGKHKVSLEDAMAAYTERQTLAKQVAEYQQQQAMLPQDIEAALLQQGQARQQLIDEAARLQQYYVPQRPSRELINPQSPHYDPDAYAAQEMDFQNGMTWLQQVREQQGQQQQAMEQERQVVQQAAIARGRNQLQQVWPEVLAGDDAGKSTRNDLAQLLASVGYDPKTALGDVMDPRAYAIMKLAVQGLKAQAQGVAQLKAVKATPRLVRGAGRTPAGQQATNGQMDRLRKTGSIDDAMPILEALLRG